MKEPKTTLFKLPLKLKDAPLEYGALLPTIQATTTHNRMLDTSTIKAPYLLISTFPDVNTKVCSLQTQHLIQWAISHNIPLINVSTNSLDEAASWCGDTYDTAYFLSDPLGVYLKKLGAWLPLFKKGARSVFLFDDQQKLIYKEITASLSKEPDLNSLSEAIKSHV